MMGMGDKESSRQAAIGGREAGPPCCSHWKPPAAALNCFKSFKLP